MPGRYALIVANGAYRDPKLSRLRTPTRDAEELARVLQRPGDRRLRGRARDRRARVRAAAQDRDASSPTAARRPAAAALLLPRPQGRQRPALLRGPGHRGRPPRRDRAVGRVRQPPDDPQPLAQGRGAARLLLQRRDRARPALPRRRPGRPRRPPRRPRPRDPDRLERDGVRVRGRGADGRRQARRSSRPPWCRGSRPARPTATRTAASPSRSSTTTSASRSARSRRTRARTCSATSRGSCSSRAAPTSRRSPAAELPIELREAIDSSLAGVREGAVRRARRPARRARPGLAERRARRWSG